MNLLALPFLQLINENVCIINRSYTNENRSDQDNPLEIGIVFIEIQRRYRNYFAHC